MVMPQEEVAGLSLEELGALVAERDQRIAELEEAVRGMLYVTPCFYRKSMPSDCYAVYVPGTTVNRWRCLLGLDH